MELWFTERHTPNVSFSIKVQKQLCSVKSRFQQIDVFDSKEFGRFLTLDGSIMFTERDEFIYHEMITHVPMAVHENPEKILVIGAGDGGVSREILKYPSVKHIDVVELDEKVTEVCRQFMPQTACGLDSPKVSLIYEDGLKFIRSAENEYDVIIVDSSDTTGFSEGLFTKEFYGNCYKALKDDGIMVNQHESPFYLSDSSAMATAHKRIGQIFAVSKIYQAHIPTYPSGEWLFGFASKKYHPVKDFNKKRFNSLKIKTNYYNAKLHKASFALPTYVEKMLTKQDW